MFGLAFASAPRLNRLTSPATVTRRFIMQKARRHTFVLRPLVGVFTPLFEVLFTFPSQYWFAIGLSGVFSLTGWSPQIRPGFLVSWVTQVSIRLPSHFAYGTVTLYGYDFHRILLCSVLSLSWILLPRRCRNIVGLGSSAFARHYLRNHCYFLFLRVLRCFSSPRLPTAMRYSHC